MLQISRRTFEASAAATVAVASWKRRHPCDLLLGHEEKLGVNACSLLSMENAAALQALSSANASSEVLRNGLIHGQQFWSVHGVPKYQGVAHSHSVPRDGEVSEDKDVAKALMPTWCPPSVCQRPSSVLLEPRAAPRTCA